MIPSRECTGRIVLSTMNAPSVRNFALGTLTLDPRVGNDRRTTGKQWGIMRLYIGPFVCLNRIIHITVFLEQCLKDELLGIAAVHRLPDLTITPCWGRSHEQSV